MQMARPSNAPAPVIHPISILLQTLLYVFLTLRLPSSPSLLPGKRSAKRQRVGSARSVSALNTHAAVTRRRLRTDGLPWRMMAAGRAALGAARQVRREWGYATPRVRGRVAERKKNKKTSTEELLVGSRLLHTKQPIFVRPS